MAAMTLSAFAGVRHGRETDLFRFAPKVKTEQTTVNCGNVTQTQQPKGAPVISYMKSPEATTLSASDNLGFMLSPKDEVWRYTIDYKSKEIDHGSYKEKVISGFKLTVYDAKYKILGTVEDEVSLREEFKETRIADINVGIQLTQKFFNYDNEYEVMIGIAANTENFVNTYRTKIYSLNNNVSIAEMEGYYCSAINTAKDAWSENFYITFLTTEATETPEINGIDNFSDYRFRTYKKAGYSGMGDAVLDVRFPEITTAGADAIPFLSTQKDGVPYFAISHLKYSWYENPFDFENENPTANNQLIVDIYSPTSSYATTIDKYSTTTFSSSTTIDDLYFLYVGNFAYDNDLNLTLNEDGHPTLYLTRAHTQRGGDSFTYDYEVYNAAPKGETAEAVKKFEIAKGVDGGYFMNDIEGFDPQVMFIDSANETYSFSFVNINNGEVEHKLNPIISETNENLSLTVETNRIAKGKSYIYYAPQTRGASDENGDVHTGIAFVDPETGMMVDYEDVNLGQNVAYAKLYTAAEAFDPYIFNLDSNREYMALIKRQNQDGNGTHEELLIASTNPEKEPLLNLIPDDQKGILANIALINLDTDNPTLDVIYVNQDNWKYTIDSYALPFTLFEQGEGTKENPYQISTIGGIKNIKAKPDAHYVIVADIDADNYTLANSNWTFTGSIDGNNHVISNLNLSERGLFPSVTGNEDDASRGTVKNIRLYNVKFTTSIDDHGMLIGNISYGTVQNIHAYNCTVSAEDNVGGLIGKATLNTKIEECMMKGDVKSANGMAGGIVGTTMTGSYVKSCSFKGTVEGDATVGGIVADMSSNCGAVTNCHVNADIKAKNTVGGIAGAAKRQVIANCHVQGTLTATENLKWGGGAKVGGITGEFQMVIKSTSGEGGESEGTVTEPTYLITNNFVNLTSISAPEAPAGAYPAQNTTVHRVVGYSGANHAEEVDYDPVTYDPIYGDPLEADPGIYNNYVISTLAKVEDAIADDIATTEGKSVTAEELGTAFFKETLKFAYGSETDAPWAETDPKAPRLYFDIALLTVTPTATSIYVGDEVTLTISLAGEEITDDTFANLEVTTDKTILGETNFIEENDCVHITYCGIKEGVASVTVKLNGQTVTSQITVKKTLGSNVDNQEVTDGLTIVDRTLTAENSTIEVYSILGARLVSGYGSLELKTLPSGIYVATARHTDGKVSTLKFFVK